MNNNGLDLWEGAESVPMKFLGLDEAGLVWYETVEDEEKRQILDVPSIFRDGQAYFILDSHSDETILFRSRHASMVMISVIKDRQRLIVIAKESETGFDIEDVMIHRVNNIH